jgi:hypothetical protein
MKFTKGLQVDLCRKFAFSAATLIQNEPTDSDTWRMVADDLERAAKYANEIVSSLAEQEDNAKGSN